ncbi:MAG: hypothetical protein V7L31_00715 [Nostoc sp.]|uniref:hypothetical protein n=1 Tax=Nostoc sp. TaxID=1180 RepID=UPI002FEFD10C
MLQYKAREEVTNASNDILHQATGSRGYTRQNPSARAENLDFAPRRRTKVCIRFLIATRRRATNPLQTPGDGVFRRFQ